MARSTGSKLRVCSFKATVLPLPRRWLKPSCKMAVGEKTRALHVRVEHHVAIGHVSQRAWIGGKCGSSTSEARSATGPCARGKREALTLSPSARPAQSDGPLRVFSISRREKLA